MSRYRLIPYLYSEFVRAAKEHDLYFRPLGFDYPEDKYAVATEDQLMLGHECMIAPVYTQNAIGRAVYLPEDMYFVKFLPDGSILQQEMGKGHHFIDVALNEVPLFIKMESSIPLVDAVETVEDIDYQTMKYIGNRDKKYEFYAKF